MKDLVIKNVVKRFDNTIAIKNTSLKIEKGSFFTFLGPSGCGKTTLLRAIAGFTDIDSGEIFLGDQNIVGVPSEKRGIGMVFQNYALFPHMTVFENVSYGLQVKKLPRKKIKEVVEEYLTLMDLKGYDDRKISELSGGEQQRVALARSLAVKPKILLLDEPLSNLDAKLRIKMRNDIKKLQKKLGITTIFVTHDQEEALVMSHQIAVFNKGECIQVGSPSEIYSNPQNIFVASFIGETNLFNISSIDNKKKTVVIEDSIELLLDTRVDHKKFVSIRPEHINIRVQNKEKVNEFRGEIKNIEFNGKFIKYIVEVGTIKWLVTKVNDFNNENILSLNQEVFIEVLPKSIKTFKE